MLYLLWFSCEPREPIFLLAFGPRDAFSSQMLPWSSLLQPLPPEDPQSGSLLLQYEPEEPRAIPSNGKLRQEVTRFQAWVPKEIVLKQANKVSLKLLGGSLMSTMYSSNPSVIVCWSEGSRLHLAVFRRKTLYESDLWGPLSGIPTRVFRVK